LHQTNSRKDSNKENEGLFTAENGHLKKWQKFPSSHQDLNLYFVKMKKKARGVV